MALSGELAGAQLTCCHFKFLYRAWDSSSEEEKLRQGLVHVVSLGGGCCQESWVRAAIWESCSSWICLPLPQLLVTPLTACMRPHSTMMHTMGVSPSSPLAFGHPQTPWGHPSQEGPG